MPSAADESAVPPPVERIGAAATLAFLTELALVVLAAVAGWRLGTPPWTSLLLAVLLPAAVIAVWGRWFAPRSAHRIEGRWRRYPWQVALIAAVAVLAALVGLPWWGAAVLVAGGLAFALAR